MISLPKNVKAISANEPGVIDALHFVNLQETKTIPL